MNRLKYVIAGLIAIGFMAFAGTADAAFVLALDDLATGGIEVVVVDNAPAGTATANVGASTDADGSGVLGAISITKTIGAWTVTVSTAFSKPLLLSSPTIHVSVVAVTTTAGPHTLVIGATDTGFGPFADAGIVSKVGGVTGGSVSVQGEADWLDQAGGVASGNAEFSGAFGPDATEQDMTVAQGPFPVGAFGSTLIAGGGPPGTPFSMTNYVVITHAGPAASSVDHEVHLNPEPATLLVFGPALALIALRRRRREN